MTLRISLALCLCPRLFPTLLSLSYVSLSLAAFRCPAHLFLPRSRPLLRNCHLLSSGNACKQWELRLPTCELCSPFLLAAGWPWVDLKHNKKANNYVGEDVSRCPTRTHTICSGDEARRWEVAATGGREAAGEGAEVGEDARRFGAVQLGRGGR